jgi:hypothetical protein
MLVTFAPILTLTNDSPGGSVKELDIKVASENVVVLPPENVNVVFGFIILTSAPKKYTISSVVIVPS